MKKIDLFFRGKYICSTTKFKTCREFKKYYLKTHHKIIISNINFYSTGLTDMWRDMLQNEHLVKCYFAKNK